MRKEKLDQTQVTQMIALYQDKILSVVGICKEFNICTRTCYRYLKREKVQPRGRRGVYSLKPEQMKEIITLYQDQALSIAKISRKFKISGRSLSNYLKRENINRDPTKRMGTPLSAAQIEEVISLYQDKILSVVGICKKFNILPGACYRYLKNVKKVKINVPKKRKILKRLSLDKNTINEMVELFQQSKITLIKLCKQYHTSETTFLYHLKKEKIDYSRIYNIKLNKLYPDKKTAEEIICRYIQGKESLAQICKQFHTRSRQFHHYLKKENIKLSELSKLRKNPLGYDKNKLKEIIARYKLGDISLKELCEQYCISITTFHFLLKENEISWSRCYRLKGKPLLMDRDRIVEMLKQYQEKRLPLTELCKIYHITAGLFQIYLKRWQNGQYL